MSYPEALYKFVVKATPEQIRFIRQLANEQDASEKQLFNERAKVPPARLAAFDQQVYETFLHKYRSNEMHLVALGVPIPRNDPKAQQKLFAIMADLAKYDPR